MAGIVKNLWEIDEEILRDLSDDSDRWLEEREFFEEVKYQEVYRITKEQKARLDQIEFELTGRCY